MKSPLHYIKVISKDPGFYFNSARCTAYFRMRGVKVSVIECQSRLPVLHTKGTVEIGDRAGFRGSIARVEIGALNSKSSLKIGKEVRINQGSSIAATCRIEIGDHTRIGSFVTILDTDFHELEPGGAIRTKPVIIGSNVWLGSNVLVLAGSKIGDHTVVAAGSIVRGRLPARVLAAGNPARVVRQLEIPDDGWYRP